jgi:hypothetical protein
MRIKTGLFCFAILLLAVRLVSSVPEMEERVEGVLVDINDARIWSGTLTFETGVHEYISQTGTDGTYSIKLKPGTYLVTVKSQGFCTIRRAAFVLQKHSSLRFDFQMWVCPSDSEFVQFAELDEVPRTHLKPLIQFAHEDLQGDLQRFHGPSTNDDGTGHARKYPAVFTFNLLRVQADEILYDSSAHLLTASGHVAWEDGTQTGAGNNVEIKLDGLKPKPNANSRRPTDKTPG